MAEAYMVTTRQQHSSHPFPDPWSAAILARARRWVLLLCCLEAGCAAARRAQWRV